MENASKALLIAAEVLIGVMILTTMIVLFTTFGDMGREYNERLETQSIMQFNSQFTKYEGTNLKAQDVQTLANLVKEWNDTGTNETIAMEVRDSLHTYDYTEISSMFLIDKNNVINVVGDNTVYPTFSMEIDNNYYESGRIRSITVRYIRFNVKISK